MSHIPEHVLAWLNAIKHDSVALNEARQKINSMVPVDLGLAWTTVDKLHDIVVDSINGQDIEYVYCCECKELMGLVDSDFYDGLCERECTYKKKGWYQCPAANCKCVLCEDCEHIAGCLHH